MRAHQVWGSCENWSFASEAALLLEFMKRLALVDGEFQPSFDRDTTKTEETRGSYSQFVNCSGFVFLGIYKNGPLPNKRMPNQYFKGLIRENISMTMPNM